MGEGTEFRSGHCLACGGNTYGMASDGPRCVSCARFVLKDDGAGGAAGAPYAAPAAPDPGPLTLARLDALTEPAGPVPPYLAARWRAVSAAFDRAFFADPPATPKRTKRKPLKTAAVLAEAEAILREHTEDRANG